MIATMVVAGVLAVLYVMLIARQLRAARAEGGVSDRSHRLADIECEAVYRRLTGTLDRAEYRDTMAAVAAHDGIERPVFVPE
ncbi:hypothetical protein KZZ52_13115 [Dactylosporangium sp. AC04546]|uniref:hypothetical protein n=1 Tax=Dactylosporangium sp. AC04546 TaxID=2862460 RepID=UPI001EDE746A|nr:hypothetical protein [Dactylosporangium sp. AC04546]WVK86276.1 hypothetical protein KZZ52_13115 [Dactylosporangium sp. AC04546]